MADAKTVEVRIPWMGIQILVGVTAFLLGVGASYLAFVGLGNGGAPDVYVEQSTQDFGDVKLGSHVDAMFVLRNEGGKPLHLQEPQTVVRAGC